MQTILAGLLHPCTCKLSEVIGPTDLNLAKKPSKNKEAVDYIGNIERAIAKAKVCLQAAHVVHTVGIVREVCNLHFMEANIEIQYNRFVY